MGLRMPPKIAENRRGAISSGILGDFGDLGDFFGKVSRTSETGSTFREKSRPNSAKQHWKAIPENPRRAIPSGVLGDLGDCQKSPKIVEGPFLVVFSAISTISAIFWEKSPEPWKLDRPFGKIQNQIQPNNTEKRFRKTAEETFLVLFSAISAIVKNRRKSSRGHF